MPPGLIAALLLADLADEWFSFLPSGALEPIRSQLGLDYARAGSLLTLIVLGALLGGAFGVVADHASRRLLAVLGALGYASCLLAFALAATFGLLAAASFSLGLSASALIAACEVALVDVAGDDLERALAVDNLLASVGDLLGPLTLAALAALGLGWRPAFALGAALMLAYAAWLWRLPWPAPRPAQLAPEDDAPAPSGAEKPPGAEATQGGGIPGEGARGEGTPGERTPGEATRGEGPGGADGKDAARVGPLQGLLSVARDPRVLRIGLAAGLFGALDEPFLGFLVAFLQRGRGQAAPAATLIAGTVLVGGMATFLVVAFARTRGGRGYGLRSAAAAAAGCALGVVALVVAPWPALQVLAGLAIGAAGAFVWVVVQAGLLGLRPGLAGTVTTVSSGLELVGVGVPVAVGMVADAAGLGAGLLVYAGVAAASALLLIPWTEHGRGGSRYAPPTA